MIMMMFVVDADCGCAGYKKQVLFFWLCYMCIFVCGCNTVIGTVAVAGWIGTARRGLGGVVKVLR